MALIVDSKGNLTFDAHSIALAGICVSLSFGLSFIKLWEMPYGGSVTLVSMLPIMIYSYTYGMKKGIERLEEAKVKNVSLTNFDTVIEVAAKIGYIKESDVERLKAFRDNPSDESWIKA